MNDEYQRMAANAIAHEAFCAGQAWQQPHMTGQA